MQHIRVNVWNDILNKSRGMIVVTSAVRLNDTRELWAVETQTVLMKLTEGLPDLMVGHYRRGESAGSCAPCWCLTL
jgi:hypothetical protein